MRVKLTDVIGDVISRAKQERVTGAKTDIVVDGLDACFHSDRCYSLLVACFDAGFRLVIVGHTETVLAHLACQHASKHGVSAESAAEFVKVLRNENHLSI